jgi:hypothetical protein
MPPNSSPQAGYLAIDMTGNGGSRHLRACHEFPAAVAVPRGFCVTCRSPHQRPPVAVARVGIDGTRLSPPMVTVLVCFRLIPVIVTWVPPGPLLGVKFEIVGIILYLSGVVRLPPGSKTVMTPVVAPAATVAVTKASVLATNVPGPNFTPVGGRSKRCRTPTCGPRTSWSKVKFTARPMYWCRRLQRRRRLRSRRWE